MKWSHIFYRQDPREVVPFRRRAVAVLVLLAVCRSHADRMAIMATRGQTEALISMTQLPKYDPERHEFDEYESPFTMYKMFQTPTGWRVPSAATMMSLAYDLFLRQQAACEFAVQMQAAGERRATPSRYDVYSVVAHRLLNLDVLSGKEGDYGREMPRLIAEYWVTQEVIAGGVDRAKEIASAVCDEIDSIEQTQ